MVWFVKRFADGQVRFSPNSTAREFLDVFDAFAATRKGAAILVARGAGGLTIYLPPVCAEFAAMIGAEEWHEPLPRALLFLAGDIDCWRGYFARGARAMRAAGARKHQRTG